MPADEFPNYPASREEKPGFLAQATRFNIMLLLAMIVPFCVLAFRPPAEQEQTARKHLHELEGRRDDLLAQKAKLRQKSDLIAKDPEYLELMARDRLQMQKDGEFIFRFED